MPGCALPEPRAGTLAEGGERAQPGPGGLCGVSVPGAASRGRSGALQPPRRRPGPSPGSGRAAERRGLGALPSAIWQC